MRAGKGQSDPPVYGFCFTSLALLPTDEQFNEFRAAVFRNLTVHMLAQ